MRFRRSIEEFGSYNPYVKGEVRIRLDKNECPFDIPDEVKEEALRRIKGAEWNRYPDVNSDSLREKIADLHGLDMRNVVVGNGGDELIALSLKLFEGDKVVISSPTFGMYSFYSRLEGLGVVDVPLREDFSLRDVENHVDGARLVVICSPNNPTGNLQDREHVERVLETGVPVLLDEAYAEFSQKSFLDLLSEHENLIVLRTFSKAFGLAAARVGYVLTSERIAERLLSIKSPFNVNFFSMKIAETALDNRRYVERIVSYIVEERERIYEQLRDCAYPSEANFLLVRLDAYDFLLERGIAVRRLEGRLKGHIRVTVGRREENDALLKALREFRGER